jgi:hypothetical protein
MEMICMVVSGLWISLNTAIMILGVVVITLLYTGYVDKMLKNVVGLLKYGLVPFLLVFIFVLSFAIYGDASCLK